MPLDQITSIADIVGVIAVVVTLGYVGLQLKQNTDAMRAQTRQGVLASSLQGIQAVVENPQVQTCTAVPDVLAPEEQVRVGSWLFMAMRATEFSWLQYRSGVIDDAQWETEKNVVAVIMSSVKYRTWWNVVGRNAFGPQFVAFIDGSIADNTMSGETMALSSSWDRPVSIDK